MNSNSAEIWPICPTTAIAVWRVGNFFHFSFSTEFSFNFLQHIFSYRYMRLTDTMQNFVRPSVCTIRLVYRPQRQCETSPWWRESRLFDRFPTKLQIHTAKIISRGFRFDEATDIDSEYDVVAWTTRSFDCNAISNGATATDSEDNAKTIDSVFGRF